MYIAGWAGFGSGFTKLGTQTLPPLSSGPITTQVGVQTGTLAVSFPNITGSTNSAPPVLSVTPLSSSAAANFSLTNNLGAYEISTTALYSASPSTPVTLCFQALTVNDQGTFNNLSVIHVVNGVPQDITVSHNFANRTVCGAATSLSPFLLVKGAVDQVNDLVRSVNADNLQHGIANGLDAKLQAVIGDLTPPKRNLSSACNDMTAFSNQVSAQEGKAISLSQAASFISAANEIKATVGCSK
jgi:hypothetical protein